MPWAHSPRWLCITARARARTATDAGELATALAALADELTDHDAASSRDGLDTTWRSCDPGPEAADPFIDLDRVFLTPLFRVEVLIQAFTLGADHDGAACIADRILATWSLEAIDTAWQADSPDDPSIVRFRDDLETARLRCN